MGQDAAKRKSSQKEIEKLVLEALYLGVTEEELIELIKKLNCFKRRGGRSHD